MLKDILIYYGLPIIAFIITLGAQIYISSTYSKFSKVAAARGITGAEAARAMLDRHGLRDVAIAAVSGTLTDHYDPKTKVVRLSQSNYSSSSVAAVSVACHECGHAIQHAENYSLMRFRSSLVPVTQISSYVGYIAILIGCIFGSLRIIYIGILAEMVILLFQLVTLPVEIDASRRALADITESYLLYAEEYDGSKKVLTAAALTYVAGVLSALLQVVRLIAIFGRRRD